jgi:two-component system, NarL family, nitrate/nitrite response regulator NarL
LNTFTHVHFYTNPPKVVRIRLEVVKTATAVMLPHTNHAIRVLIVDDEPLFREMVQALLEAEEGIEVVGKAKHGKEGVELADELTPDVIVMDISMPVMNGLDATREIRERDPNACVLILTGGSNISEVDRARKAGAAGYLTKDRIAGELVAEIRSVAGR